MHDAHAALADLLDHAVGPETLVPLPGYAVSAVGLVGATARMAGDSPLCPVVRRHAPTVRDRERAPALHSPTQPGRRRIVTAPGRAVADIESSSVTLVSW